jgi:signal transduction histidine kinase
MHDVLGHQLSLIVAQASTTRRVYADRPEATAEALGSIESVGRDALSGLRRVVGLLRADRGRPPGLDGLHALVGQLGRAGLPAQLVVNGTQRPLAPEVELTAFRIVQEALTNSLRHSGRSGVTITLTYGDDALDIDVTDAGPSGPPTPVPPPRAALNGTPPAGFGLVGMHQRVELLGGGLAAGPVGGGGFRVRARLPLVAAPAADGAGPA